MKLNIKDENLVVEPSTKYYVWRWALTIGIPLYIATMILLAVFVNSLFVLIGLLGVFVGSLIIFYFGYLGYLLWEGFAEDIKNWLLEEKT